MKSLITLLLLFTILWADQGEADLIAVKKELIAKGLSAKRVETIFNSDLANVKETLAVEKIRNIKNIKKHRKAEKKANDDFLLKSTLIKKHLKKYKKVYDKVEKDFQINREIVAAILQKETALGAYKSYKHNSLSVYTSMIKGLQVRDETGRAKIRLERFVKFAKDNLIALITFYELNGKDVLKADLRSSYAGAVGIPQFSPMHFDMMHVYHEKDPLSLHYMPTAIYSTANLLKNRFGWNKRLSFARIRHLDKVIKRWHEFHTGSENFVYEKNLDGITVPTFMNSCSYDKEVAYVAEYIKVLKRYNFSTNYALGILQIAKASRD
jgi:membrane-bound lytic murein transglycosylase B